MIYLSSFPTVSVLITQPRSLVHEYDWRIFSTEQKAIINLMNKVISKWCFFHTISRYLWVMRLMKVICHEPENLLIFLFRVSSATLLSPFRQNETKVFFIFLLPLLPFNIKHISLLTRRVPDRIRKILSSSCAWTKLLLLRYRLFPSAWFWRETKRKKNWNTEKLFSLFIFTCVIIVSLKRHDYVHLIWNTPKKL